MDFAHPLIPGTLVRRYKRFLADVALPGGEVTAHCPNPGAMTGLADPGMRVWLEPNDDPRRKLRHAWRLVELPDAWAGIDTGVPNRLVAEALAAGTLPALTGYTEHRAEVPYGTRSRVDFRLRAPGRPDCYLEVKNVHLRRQPGLIEFPDCVTTRGARHLGDLAEMVAQGARAVLLYVVQHSGARALRLAGDIDPGYVAAATRARAAGVEMLAHTCTITPDRITLAGELPILPPERV